MRKLASQPFPYVGVDLGQRQDYTAITVIDAYPVRRVLRRGGGKRIQTTLLYQVRRIDRYREVPFPDIVERIVDITMSRGEATGKDVNLCVDVVGMGMPVRDYILKSFKDRNDAADGKGVGLIPGWIYTTSGGNVTEANGQVNTPRKLLVSSTDLAMQDGRVEVARMRQRDDLYSEMRTLTLKQNAQTGHETYEHYRESDKDDIITSVMLCVFAAEHYRLPGVEHYYRVTDEEREQAEAARAFDSYETEPAAYTAITHSPVPPRVESGGAS